MKKSIQELSSQGYEPFFELNHAELLPFVRANSRGAGFFPLFFKVSLFFGLAAFAFACVWGIMSGLDPLSELLSAIAFSFAIFIVLIPIHELLHALAYWMVGAKKVRFVAKWRQMMFLAVADRFVSSYAEMLFVALCPFFVLGIALYALGSLLSPYILVFATFSACLHTSACIGDFAILSFLRKNGGSALICYDLHEEKRTVFLRKRA